MFVNIQGAVKSMRKATFQRTPQWNLGQLIDSLSKIEATDDCWVSFSFCDFVPGTCHSWRGSYNEIAISYEALDWDKKPRLKDFLKHLNECIGVEFTGWKGGEYIMGHDTPVWVAEPGRSGNTGVVGIHCENNNEGKAYRVAIRTDYCEF
jgi:hypothetical protein